MIIEYEKKYIIEPKDKIKINVAFATLDINQKVFSEQLGMTIGYINRVLNGRVSINQQLLDKIEEILQIKLG